MNETTTPNSVVLSEKSRPTAENRHHQQRSLTAASTALPMLLLELADQYPTPATTHRARQVRTLPNDSAGLAGCCNRRQARALLVTRLRTCRFSRKSQIAQATHMAARYTRQLADRSRRLGPLELLLGRREEGIRTRRVPALAIGPARSSCAGTDRNVPGRFNREPRPLGRSIRASSMGLRPRQGPAQSRRSLPVGPAGRDRARLTVIAPRVTTDPPTNSSAAGSVPAGTGRSPSRSAECSLYCSAYS